MKAIKIAIVATHPVQYNVPWFVQLSKEPNIEVKVFYTFSQRENDSFDNDFCQNIDWDIPLLENYAFQFIHNSSSKPGLSTFGGINCPSLISEINKWGTTHLLVFGWNYHAHLKAMRYFKGKIPVLFRGDSTIIDYTIRRINDISYHHFLSDSLSLSKFLIRKLFLTWVYRHVDMAFSVGSNNTEYFRTHGIANDRIKLVPHAIDNTRFGNESREIEQQLSTIKSNHSITPDDFLILFCGKFERKKNPLLLANAVIQLKAAYPHHSFKLLFVGNGNLDNEIKQLALKYKFINVLPFQNQTMMPLIYRMGNALCLPSQGPGETWGLVVNEALASGSPVIASNKVGCATDLIKDENGYIFKNNDIEDLKAKLLLAYEKSYNREGIKASIQEYSFANIVKSILILLPNS